MESNIIFTMVSAGVMLSCISHSWVMPMVPYPALGYRKMLKTYQKALNEAVGNTKVLIAGDTLQVKDYSRFNWTMFDAASKRERHEKVFPEEQKKAFRLGAQMVTKPW